MKKLPIGVDNFQKLASGDYLFCDKTAMIAAFLNKGDEVTLITRPRRWGKTLNMSMLQHFFSSEVNGVSTAGLFDDLEIGKLNGGSYVTTHQGQSPVIMISFKDVNADSFKGAIDIIYLLIKRQYGSFEYLLKSNKLNSDQKCEFNAILDKSANQSQLENSLELLSQCLYQHHGKKVYILVDEYDTPLNKAYGNKAYLKSMVQFMRNLFSASLKGNHALERGVLTGILRISKDSMLSGLNNLKTYTLLDQGYGDHFGFLEDEVSFFFKEKALTSSMEEVRSWYNGYKVGNLVMYNPWSIISCLSEEGRFDVYWVNTGNNDLIKQLIFSSSSGIKEQFEQLMQGETLAVSIDKHLSFDLLGTNENALWSLLLFAGYLKAVDVVFNTRNGLYDCKLAIPNQEVATLYNRFFEEWLISKFPSQSRYDIFIRYLLSGKVNEFIQDLNIYLFQSASFFDTTAGKRGESFYHGFTLAMLASISDSHYIRSNRESGLGRYDILIIPKNGPKALLLEFKYLLKSEELESSAKLALQQIQSQAYHTELLQYPHVQSVVEVGIAFSGKSVVAAYATYDLVNKQAGDIILTNRYVQEEC
ncbi:AAA family ATPase [Cardinium endosymbiont of Tipula unca]|uniref:AAA family ATPase n=1 Tax=Cardinium endosymbiont of Tipula unca TaxID=3066216 RepID=UPI0030D3BC2F